MIEIFDFDRFMGDCKNYLTPAMAAAEYSLIVGEFGRGRAACKDAGTGRVLLSLAAGPHSATYLLHRQDFMLSLDAFSRLLRVPEEALSKWRMVKDLIRELNPSDSMIESLKGLRAGGKE